MVGLNIANKEIANGNSALASEAINIFLWCLSQSLDCYKQWDDIYVDNLEASVIVPKQLSDEWKVHTVKHSSLDTLDAALKSFRDKNEKALASGNNDITSDVLLKEANKHCKVMLSKFSRGHGCLKATGFLTVTMVVGVALIIKDPRN
ncbi:transmembrane protein [Tanacetum coccineum]